MIDVTVTLNDGTDLDLRAVTPPWEWRHFLVIDPGTERLQYLPLRNVRSFSMAGPTCSPVHSGT